mmetsp:Transcript_6853/g.12268  ORF Transcript_6853/g.12268 Transcript_6853/m.12268 type:complete len:184 (-) Transcript_6853:494-1045(-)
MAFQFYSSNHCLTSTFKSTTTSFCSIQPLSSLDHHHQRRRACITSLSNNNNNKNSMNDVVSNSFSNLTRAFQSSTIRQTLLFSLLFYLILTGNLTYLFDSIFAFIILLLLFPFVLTLGFNLYSRVYILTNSCPNCNFIQPAIKNKQFRCINCNANLIANENTFEFVDASDATVDVQAKDITEE